MNDLGLDLDLKMNVKTIAIKNERTEKIMMLPNRLVNARIPTAVVKRISSREHGLEHDLVSAIFRDRCECERACETRR